MSRLHVRQRQSLRRGHRPTIEGGDAAGDPFPWGRNIVSSRKSFGFIEQLACEARTVEQHDEDQALNDRIAAVAGTEHTERASLRHLGRAS
jgi:hypothetical protein